MRALRGREIGAGFKTRVGLSRRLSARIGRATGRRRDEPGETRAPRVPCLKRPARLMARPERARYWGVLQDARGAEPALQRTDRTAAGRPPTGPAPVVPRALKGRLGSWPALRRRDIVASLTTRGGPSRPFSARIGRRPHDHRFVL